MVPWEEGDMSLSFSVHFLMCLAFDSSCAAHHRLQHWTGTTSPHSSLLKVEMKKKSKVRFKPGVFNSPRN